MKMNNPTEAMFEGLKRMRDDNSNNIDTERNDVSEFSVRISFTNQICKSNLLKIFKQS